MKKYYILIAGMALVFMSNRGGRNIGTTGAPGETGQLCSSCHSGGSLSADMEISLMNSDGDVVTEYIAGQEYDLTVTFTGDVAAGYGFQLVPLTESDDRMAGSWGELGSDVRILDNLSRTYIVQSDRKEEGLFTAKWVAPAEGSGSVKFYSTGVAANGNGGTSGDVPTITTLSMGEGSVTSVEELQFDINMYPNPATDFLSVETKEDVSYTIYSTSGQTILMNLSMSNNHYIDVSTFENGMYMITVDRGSRSSSQWFVKE